MPVSKIAEGTSPEAGYGIGQAHDQFGLTSWMHKDELDAKPLIPFSMQGTLLGDETKHPATHIMRRVCLLAVYALSKTYGT